MDEEEILKRAQELSQPEPIQEEKQEDKKGMRCNKRLLGFKEKEIWRVIYKFLRGFLKNYFQIILKYSSGASF